MHALCLRVNITRQRIRVGGFKLRQLAPVDDLARQRQTFSSQIFQNLRRGRPLTGFGLGGTRQTHLAKKNIAKLLGRADIEFFTGKFVNFVFIACSRLCEITRQARENLTVNRNAALFHAGKHIDQRTL
ncbi:hypothetical protein D3C80_1596820 [compost metagenome]